MCVNIPQSLLIVAGRVALLLHPLKAVRLPHVGRHFLSFVTDLPPNVMSSAPPLEARRLPPVHLTISCIIYYGSGV